MKERKKKGQRDKERNKIFSNSRWEKDFLNSKKIFILEFLLPSASSSFCFPGLIKVFKGFGTSVVLKILEYSTLNLTLNILWASLMLNAGLSIISRTVEDNCIMENHLIFTVDLRCRTCFKKWGPLSYDIATICSFLGTNDWFVGFVWLVGWCFFSSPHESSILFSVAV